jgi:dihydroorotate dehydrogenase electron transfer subunit
VANEILQKGSTRYFNAKVLENRILNKDFRLLIIQRSNPSVDIGAGQFYMLQCSKTYDPLLKRPFSIFRFDDESLQFLYRIRGRGTRVLSSLRYGDIITAIGPLGNGFPEPGSDFIAVGGGVGIAPLMPLLEKFKKRGYLFYGAATKDEIVAINDAGMFSKEFFICTDDGTVGEKGRVTDLLEISFLFIQDRLPIYACGPNPMLKSLSLILENKRSVCFVSLEEYMACGIGACLGCVVKCKEENSSMGWVYKRVCKEGPVFDIKEVIW